LQDAKRLPSASMPAQRLDLRALRAILLHLGHGEEGAVREVRDTAGGREAEHESKGRLSHAHHLRGHQRVVVRRHVDTGQELLDFAACACGAPGDDGDCGRGHPRAGDPESRLCGERKRGHAHALGFWAFKRGGRDIMRLGANDWNSDSHTGCVDDRRGAGCAWGKGRTLGRGCIVPAWTSQQGHATRRRRLPPIGPQIGLQRRRSSAACEQKRAMQGETMAGHGFGYPPAVSAAPAGPRHRRLAPRATSACHPLAAAASPGQARPDRGPPRHSFSFQCQDGSVEEDAPAVESRPQGPLPPRKPSGLPRLTAGTP